VRIAFVVVLAAVGAFAAPAEAASFHRDETPLPKGLTGAGSAHAASVSSGMGSAVVHMVLGLTIVVGLIFGIYWLLKRTSRKKDAPVVDDGFLDVVSTTPLGPQRSMHLVRVGDELVLLAASEHSVTPVRVYSPEEARRLGVDRVDDPPVNWESPTEKPSFVESLRRRTSR
jgi:flagellar protein FliO/FliZ